MRWEYKVRIRDGCKKDVDVAMFIRFRDAKRFIQQLHRSDRQIMIIAKNGGLVFTLFGDGRYRKEE